MALICVMLQKYIIKCPENSTLFVLLFRNKIS